MLKNIYSALVVCLLLIFAQVYAQDADYGAQVVSKNTALGSNDAIKSALQVVYNVNPILSSYNLKVSVKDDVVTLEGAVPNQYQKDLAGLIAAKYQGVNSVNNNVVVDPKTRAGENTSAYGRQVADATITALIKSRLALDSEVSSRNIQVTTANNVVTLSGWVNSLSEKAKAGQIAVNSSGVDTVKNNLAIKK